MSELLYDLVGGSWLVLRRGKKKIAGVEVR